MTEIIRTRIRLLVINVFLAGFYLGVAVTIITTYFDRLSLSRMVIATVTFFVLSVIIGIFAKYRYKDAATAIDEGE